MVVSLVDVEGDLFDRCRWYCDVPAFDLFYGELCDDESKDGSVAVVRLRDRSLLDPLDSARIESRSTGYLAAREVL